MWLGLLNAHPHGCILHFHINISLSQPPGWSTGSKRLNQLRDESDWPIRHLWNRVHTHLENLEYLKNSWNFVNLGNSWNFFIQKTGNPVEACCLLWTFWCCSVSAKKVKFSHTRYRALGPELIPVYRQSVRRWREVIHAINPAVVCHCFLPGLHLPSQLSPDGATCKRQHTSDSSLLLILSTPKGWKAELA